MTSIQNRVINIVKSPATEWPVIAAETGDVGSLYKDYIMPLAAIPPVAQFIGLSLIGASMPFVGYYRRPMGQGISAMVLSYVFALAAVYICAMVIEGLAPKFKSSGTRFDALKLVAYASTPGWVGAVFYIIPGLSIIAMLASLYGIYVFYLGLPVMLKTPSDQVVPFMIVSALVIIVVSLVLGTFATALTVGSAVAGGVTPF
jgi:hypothetical protein